MSFLTAAPLVKPDSLSHIVANSCVANPTHDAVQVVCGHFHSFARSVEGILYAWGKNSNGQLGIGTVTVCEVQPVKVAISAQVQHMSAGPCPSLSHSHRCSLSSHLLRPAVLVVCSWGVLGRLTIGLRRVVLAGLGVNGRREEPGKTTRMPLP